ncbi:LCP family protein required for cell wall assembly [Deinobacterium chartae]|uniref:LCP family protein required for cell wall assembly n=1 Tax=Deinobacterium chartae TaxID=521158 RepID=A0A841I4A1_9DEIO|nr:LCP family protein [Deinobacterium chartae]MBB6099129.1 LCP family protein required for cell wall assembly [Deinobacterium chartae]
MRLAKALALAVLLLLAGLLAYLAPAAPALSRYAALPAEPPRPLNYLVAGVTPKYSGHHTRAPEDFRGLTDTILIVQVRPGGQGLRLLSVPRDTMVNTPGYGWGKVNAANVHLGPQALMGALENLTGLELRGYALLSLDALREITDALGGVEVYVPQDMKYTDTAAGLRIDLKKGRQHLSGEQAEGYLRFRYDALGDIGRVQRQQGFMRDLAARALSPAGLLRLPKAVGAAERNLRTNLTRVDVGYVLGALLHRPQLESSLLPGNFGNVGGASYWIPDRDGIARLVQTRFGSRDTQTDVHSFGVAVVNVGAPDGAAHRARERLLSLGYRNVWITRMASGDESRTAVFSRQGLEPARQVARDLGVGEAYASGEGVLGADITVRLGADAE